MWNSSKYFKNYLIHSNKNEKTGIIAAAGLAALISSCSSSAPKADMKTDVDSLSYSIGMAQTQGLKPYLVNRLGVDTTYLAEFVKGLNEGANAGDDKKKQLTMPVSKSANK